MHLSSVLGPKMLNNGSQGVQGRSRCGVGDALGRGGWKNMKKNARNRPPGTPIWIQKSTKRPKKMNTVVLGHPGAAWEQKKVVSVRVQQKYIFGSMKLFKSDLCFGSKFHVFL